MGAFLPELFCVVSGQVGELSAPADCWEWERTHCLGKVKSEKALLHLGDLQRWWDLTYKQESPLQGHVVGKYSVINPLCVCVLWLTQWLSASWF